MSQSPSAQITIEQRRNREIIATELLGTASSRDALSAAVSAPVTPLSVFGRKVAGYDH